MGWTKCATKCLPFSGDGVGYGTVDYAVDVTAPEEVVGAGSLRGYRLFSPTLGEQLVVIRPAMVRV